MKSFLIIFALLLFQPFIGKAQAESTSLVPSPQIQKVRPILTPEQHQARRDFIKTYRASSQQTQIAMKQQIKTDPALRLKLGLKPVLSTTLLPSPSPQVEQSHQSTNPPKSDDPTKINIVPRPPLGPALTPPEQTYKNNKETPVDQK
jgi:hypothetical protein